MLGPGAASGASTKRSSEHGGLSRSKWRGPSGLRSPSASTSRQHCTPRPATHGNAPQRWFVTHQPASGLPASVYNLVRYSGEARVAAVATIADKYLQEADDDAILRDAGPRGS
jgi:hypothetical protein